MTFAVEPKIVFPGEGSVELENTILVTRNGYEILTTLETEILRCKNLFDMDYSPFADRYLNSSF